MSNSPLVSVIIPCYNHEKYIKDCIHSIINQDYQNIELIIIDDGSKDNSIQRIQDLKDICYQRFSRFEYRHRPNKGLPATLNEGLDWCQGKYVSIIASDDLMLPNKTSIQVEFLECNPHISSISTNIQMIDDYNTVIETTNHQTGEFTFEEVLTENRFLAPSQMHCLDTLKKLKGYNEEIKIEDWYMWLKLLKNGYRIFFMEQVTAQYRRHETNITNNILNMIEYEHDILNLYKNEPLYQKLLHKLMLRKNKILYYRCNKIKYYYFKYKIIISYKIKNLIGD